MKRLALLGASGHGKVVADIALLTGWEVIDFYDDAWPKRNQNGRWPVIGDTEALLSRLSDYQGVLVSIGHCAIRWEKQQRLQALAAPLISLIHPMTSVSRFSEMGPGTVLMAGAVVNVDAVIGAANIINTGATVDHDCRLSDAVHICPGAHLSGDVQVGHGSWVGVGATIKQGMTIGRDVMIGAGAVVVRPVADGQTVIGNPARLLTKRDA